MAPVSDSTPRPPHTTMAAGMVIGGSVLVVLTVGQQLASLRSMETRQAVSDFLSTTPVTGLEVPDALVLLRIALMVVAGCATAAAILGYHVLKRNRGARLGLTVVAVPLFIGGLATGGFLTSLVAVSTMLLWLTPSRAWLDRTPVPTRPGPGPRGVTSEAPDPPRPAEASSDRSSPGPAPSAPPPHAGTFGAPAPLVAPPSTAPGRRPDSLLWACILTWSLAGLAIALLGASLTLLLADPSLVWEELERQNPGLLADSGLSQSELLRTTYLTIGMAIAWSLAAAVLALLAFRRRPAGRLGLLVLALLTTVVCGAASLASVVMLVPTVAGAVTVVLLSRGDVRTWFAAPRSHP